MHLVGTCSQGSFRAIWKKIIDTFKTPFVIMRDISGFSSSNNWRKVAISNEWVIWNAGQMLKYKQNVFLGAMFRLGWHSRSRKWLLLWRQFVRQSKFGRMEHLRKLHTVPPGYGWGKANVVCVNLKFDWHCWKEYKLYIYSTIVIKQLVKPSINSW